MQGVSGVMTHYIKSVALTVMESKNLNGAHGLKAYRAAVGLLLPAAAVYGNYVLHAIFPSSADNFSGTRACARYHLQNRCTQHFDETWRTDMNPLMALLSVQVQCKSSTADVCQTNSWFRLNEDWFFFVF